MMTVMPPQQLRVYAGLHDLEATLQVLEGRLATAKRDFLHGGDGAGREVATALGEMRQQMQRLQQRAEEMEKELAAMTATAAPVEQREAARPVPMLRGSTEVVAMPDLVSFLASLKKTGTLSLQAPEAMFTLEFQDGAVVHAATNAPDPELRLGTVLVAQSLLTQQQLQSSLQASAASRELLGDLLVRTATVSENDLRTALAAQVQRIFGAAFQVRFAQFAFVDGSVSAIAQRVQLNTMHLLLDAARLADERQQSAVTNAVEGALPG